MSQANGSLFDWKVKVNPVWLTAGVFGCCFGLHDKIFLNSYILSKLARKLNPLAVCDFIKNPSCAALVNALESKKQINGLTTVAAITFRRITDNFLFESRAALSVLCWNQTTPGTIRLKCCSECLPFPEGIWWERF